MLFLKSRIGSITFSLLGLLLAFPVGSQAGTLTGSFAKIASGSNVDLTTTGKLDWVHWGLYTASSLNRKAGVTPQIGNFTLLGNNSSYTLAAYQYTDNSNSYSWYDGTPVTTVTNTTTGVWAYDYMPVGSGFKLTVPADTTLKTLQVYVGAYAAEGQFTATLSDGSAPGFTNGAHATVNNFGNGPGGVFTINFAADSSNQTLTVTWTLFKVNGSPLNAPNVTLQAATLTAASADNPPFVTVTNPASNMIFPAPASISIQADARDFDGSVTNVAFYEGTNKLGQTTSSPYEYTWNNAPRGHYFLTAKATDNAGVTSTSQPVEVFVYGTGGSQTNSVTTSPATVNLTAEGTADWTHWGTVDASSFDHKAGVTGQISNFTELGTNTVQQYGDNYTAFSWSDGTPTVSTNGTTTGVFVTGDGNGFKITAPAGTNSSQLRIYVGGYGVQGEFQAWLSDLSAPPYIDTSSVNNEYGNDYVTYTINYRAATNNQQLIVVFHSLNLYDTVYGNVTLQAATLQSSAPQPPPPPQPVQITNPQRLGSEFAFSFATQTNYNYEAQYTYSLNPPNWQSLTSFPGTGSSLSITNQNATNATCFYRVVAQ